MRSKGLRSIRARLVAVAATLCALGVVAPVPAASAQIGVLPGGGLDLSSLGCTAGNRTGVGQTGGSGGTADQFACGSVLAFNGPSVGSVSSVIGPTIIGSTVVAPVTVSTGGPVVNSAP